MSRSSIYNRSNLPRLKWVMLRHILTLVALMNLMGLEQTQANDALRYCGRDPAQVATPSKLLRDMFEFVQVSTLFRHGDRIPCSNVGMCWEGEDAFECSDYDLLVGLQTHENSTVDGARSSDVRARSADTIRHRTASISAENDLAEEPMMEAEIDAQHGGASMNTFRSSQNEDMPSHARRSRSSTGRDDPNALIDVSRSVDNYRSYFRTRFSANDNSDNENDDEASEAVNRESASEGDGSEQPHPGTAEFIERRQQIERRRGRANPFSISMAKKYMRNTGVWKGNCHTGSLTKRGVDQLRQLGGKIFEAYGSVLGGSTEMLREGRYFIRSTDVPRTIASAQALITGFTESALVNLWKNAEDFRIERDNAESRLREAAGEISDEDESTAEHNRLQKFVSTGLSEILSKVPINTIDFLSETFLPNTVACPKLLENFQNLQSHPDWVHHNQTITTPLLERVRIAMQGRRYQTQLRNIFDCLGSHLCQGNKLPGDVTPSLFKELENDMLWHELQTLIYPNSVEGAQLSIGGFLQQLGGNILHHALSVVANRHRSRGGRLGEENPFASFRFSLPYFPGLDTSDHVKFALYSGHDTSLLAMLTGLNAFNFSKPGTWPPYASHVEIELLHSRSGVSSASISEAGFGFKMNESFPIETSSLAANQSVYQSPQQLVMHFLRADRLMHLPVGMSRAESRETQAEDVRDEAWVRSFTADPKSEKLLGSVMDQFFVRVIFNGTPLKLAWCEPQKSNFSKSDFVRRFARAVQNKRQRNPRERRTGTFQNEGHLDPSSAVEEEEAYDRQLREEVAEELRTACPLPTFLEAIHRVSPKIDPSSFGTSLHNGLFDARCGAPSYFVHFS